MALYLGKANDVIGALKREIEEANAHGWVRRKIKLLILQSIANKLTGDTAEAYELMYGALTLAAPQSYVATFIEEGSVCMEMISDIYRHNLWQKKSKLQDFISGFIENSDDESESEIINQSECVFIEKLTKKEHEVLSLVVAGFSNIEIAERIFVSTNTVKFHMKNLYGKLGASSRFKLIAMAKSLGIE